MEQTLPWLAFPTWSDNIADVKLTLALANIQTLTGNNS